MVWREAWRICANRGHRRSALLLLRNPDDLRFRKPRLHHCPSRYVDGLSQKLEEVQELRSVAVEKWLEIVDLTASQVLRLLDGVCVSLRPELTNLDRYFH